MRRMFPMPLVFAACAALVGCAANVRHDNSAAPIRVTAAAAKSVAIVIDGSAVATAAKDWNAFKGEWYDAMRDAAGTAHIAYLESGRAPTNPAPGTLVTVYVNDYRYVSTGARYAAGIMTGNAFVDAKVTLTDMPSGARFGERAYNTSSSAWQGIFSAMTAKQIGAICHDIVADITAPPAR